MSGVWGGWLRRLRRGQNAEPADQTAEPLPTPDFDLGTLHEPIGSAAPPEEAEPAPPPPGPSTSGGPEPEPPGSPPPEAPVSPGADTGASSQTAEIRLLLRQGALAQAEAAADGRWGPLAEALRQGEAVLDAAGLPSFEGEADIMLAPAVGGRRELLVVFGADDGRFAIPATLAPRSRQPHLLFVRDPGQSLAMLGVSRLGASYDRCLLSILRIARTLEAEHVFCLGGGAACYSALRYGLDLGAAGVAALGTLVNLEKGQRTPGVRPGRSAGRLLKLAEELGADLHAAYAGTVPRPGLVVCRPRSGAPSDLATLPGTVVVATPSGIRGDLLDWADGSGRLTGMVRELLRCRPVE